MDVAAHDVPDRKEEKRMSQATERIHELVDRLNQYRHEYYNQDVPMVAPRLKILALIPSQVKFSSVPVATMVHPANLLFVASILFSSPPTVFKL